MGLAALRDLLDPEPVNLDELAGSRVAVDADNLLWSFVKGMARGGAPTGPHGRATSHAIGVVNRLDLFARLDVEPVWVFDGAPPSLKAETIAEREARRAQAAEAGDEVGAARLGEDQVDEVKALLEALGVAWFQAPGEADAQLARWVREHDVDAGITQDYDAALFGCPTTLRYVKTTGSRDPERIPLDRRLDEAELTRQQLVDAAVLIGTDYNDGVHGVGPVRGVSLVREHGDVWAAAEAFDGEVDRAEAVRELFLDPAVDDTGQPDPPKADPAAARQELERHGLDPARAARLVDAFGGPQAADRRTR